MKYKKLFAKNKKFPKAFVCEVTIAPGVKALCLGIPGHPLTAGPRHAQSQGVSICLICK